jgi:deoxyribonuclease I
MKRFLGTFIFVFIVQVLFSFSVEAKADHHNYYPLKFQRLVDGVKQNKGFDFTKSEQEVLRTELFKILSSHHQKVKNSPDKLGCSSSSNARCYIHSSLGYRGARKVLFGKIHLEEDNRGYFVKDVYCRKEFTNKQTNVGPNIIPNSNLLNCEHTWPQSKFTGRFGNDIQKSDLHHLYPTDSRANSVRGNYNFGEVNGSAVPGNCEASRIGHDRRSSGSRGNRFEPPTEHKGNVARALFYFSVRYQISISASEEAYLREWHIEDPVDAKERERNSIIYNVQNNRNPFIDYPELVTRLQDF